MMKEGHSQKGNTPKNNLSTNIILARDTN